MVIERIGVGGTAQVFLVRAEDGKRHALKVLSDHRFEVTNQMRERFRREGKMLAAVQSANVIGLVEMTACQGEPVMVLECAEGGSIAKILEHLKAPPPRAVSLRWLSEALRGTDALHHGGRIHRDLTPKNLLLRGDGSLVVADFGTVRHVDDETLTQADDRIGSLIYISRQQVENPHLAEARDDVYSLGQIAWQLLSGRRPHGNTPELATACPSAPPGLIGLIERMRDDDPKERPLNAGRALAELDALRDLLVKPGLRRPSFRLGTDGEPRETVWSASANAVADRQRTELRELAAQLPGDPLPKCLEILVGLLGALHIKAAETNVPVGHYRLAPPRWLLSGSLDAARRAPTTIDLLTLQNSITGLTLSYAVREPHVVQEAAFPTLMAGLAGLECLSLTQQQRVLEIFGAAQFARGVNCALCAPKFSVPLSLMRSGSHPDSLFRAGVCDSGHHDEQNFMCCICGSPFRRAGSSDEYGPYDAVGCDCPNLAFDVEFGERPWNEGVSLKGDEAVAFFEGPMSD